jgi:hypothetical protein
MAAEFDAVSVRSGWYLVARDHERRGAEEVLERHERYLVVSRPLPAEQAAASASGGRLHSEDTSNGS